ncbi:TetR/AcrR family transcriptional regulator [Blastococcus sp. CT_GayMR16]|uniref:TetR/AcrR family transcriptional regulator n=1 Tax=Blastococcus sp. CT_GayMR16 TaxID=2559607 RepID=UPI001073BB3C|nr:TetR/AcrR family transcriptional regulator [Blastococcus sp. CT_GayMR16]TFV88866.1 TetR/AcrR family transcriptional regulator [Blastococcus sp. CT_GayMR16]
MPSGSTSSDTAPEGVVPRRRPGRPPQSEGAETRRHILEVATRHFLQAGYDGTSMQAIAEDAGLTRTALYNYFRSRADLARAVLFEHTVESARRGLGHQWWVDAPVDGLSGRERLRGLLRASLDDALRTLEMGDFYMILVRESANDPQLRKALRDYVGGLRNAIRAILDESVSSGELPEDTDVDRLLESVLGMAWALSSGITTAPSDKVRRQVSLALDLVLDTAPWRAVT